jgi:hypothetical protein
MAITYPRLLPSFLIADESRFELNEASSVSRTLGNVPLAMQLADPRWMFSISTQPLKPDQADEVAAWWETLRGGGKSFLAHDMRRNYPINYAGGVSALVRAGGGAFDGTAKVAAVTTNTITIGDATGFLPASFVLKAGDKIGLVSAGVTPRYSVHRVVEDVTANGSGVAVASVYPFVATTRFTAGDTANMVRPLAEFVPDRDSWSRISTSAPTPISFGGWSRAYS